MRFPSQRLTLFLSLVIGCLPLNLSAQTNMVGTTPQQATAEPSADTGRAGAFASGKVELAAVDQTNYVVSRGDLLDVAVFGVPELSQRARVSAGGEIYLPLVNSVPVAGLNLDDVRKALETRFLDGKFLKNPHVSVTVLEFASGVVVLGEVVKPGIYPIAGSRRLFDVLSAAGGVTQNAGSAVTITHPGAKQETVYLARDPLMNTNSNIMLHQGDMISVARAGVVYVVGEVTQPSGILMAESTEYTALKALAMAHGPSKLAALNKAVIVRRTPEGIQSIPVPLKKIMSSKAPDVAMQRDDILVIPNSIAKTAGYQGLNAAVSLASGVAMVGVSRATY